MNLPPQHNAMKHPLLTLSLSLFLALSLGRGAAAQGTLVIVGGGLDPDNEAVYRAVLDRMPADGTLGVLPTASGVPEESGPLTVQDFEQYSGPEQKIELIDLRNGEVDKANDPAWAQRIAACDALWFTGGDQARIVSTFRVEPVGDANPELEDGPDSLCYEAVIGVFRGGGVVGGTSAGAAMMSDPMILWGNSQEALLMGEISDVPDFGVGLGRGMGLIQPNVPGSRAIVDQHFAQRGRLGRLVVAMMVSEASTGLGIDENTAVVVEGDPARTSVVGEGHAYLVLFELDMFARFQDQGDLLAAFACFRFGDGEVMSGHNDADELQQPDAAALTNLLAGAPRAYEGPPPFTVEVVKEGAIPLVVVYANDLAETVTLPAEKRLEEARK